jgi:hypothetical protein
MVGSTLPLTATTPLRGARGVVGRTFTAALAVFALDGLYVVTVFAVLLHRTTAERIFQGIAFAAIGPSAVVGGWRTAALGLFLHFCVALGWSAVWAVIYEHSSSLRRTVSTTSRALAVGALYGAAIWLAMELVVLPLTHAKPGPLFTVSGMFVMLAHLLVIGPPIVLVVRRPGLRTSTGTVWRP